MENVQLTKESFTNYRYFEPEDEREKNGSAKAFRRRTFVTYLTLFQSDLYCINDLNCYYDTKHIFAPTYTGNFSINFTRSGYFTFETYRRKEEEYASRIMLEKPGCEFRFIQQQPGDGSCTVISFTPKGYEAIRNLYPVASMPFFSNKDMFSTVIAANAAADLLHHRILQRLTQGSASRLEMDCLVAELTEAVMTLVNGARPAKQLSASLRQYHLCTLERAREYLLAHFAQDITLHELASNCYVSQFHFTRLFKQLCGYSPFYYLQQIRLKHAEMLLRTTSLPVTDVCFRSGFNRLDYFSGSFSKQFGRSPGKYRLNQSSVSFERNPVSRLLAL